MMEIFPGIRYRIEKYKAIRVETLYMESDGMKKILDCVNKRAMICHAGMDELNALEIFGLSVLKAIEEAGG